MPPKKARTSPVWSDVKAKLAAVDRAGLLGLLQDLYAADKNNRTFLHSRLGVGADPLAVYKKAIESAVSFDWNKPVRLTEARKAIADYRKAIGKPDGMLELQTFFCERAMAFSMEFGFMDDAYASAIATQFAGAAGMLKVVLPPVRDEYVARLAAVVDLAGNVGYGLDSELGDLLAEAGFEV